MKKKIPIIIIAIFCSMLFLLPLVWMIFTSFKTIGEAIGSTSLLPKQWTLQNYIDIFVLSTDTPLRFWMENTFIVTTMGTLLVLITNVLAAYSLARLDVPGKKYILGIILLSMTIPGIVTLFPAFYLFRSAGLLNTFLPLILPYSAGTMGVFLIYNFLLSFPKELEEAAYVDGASQWTILLKVILPSIKPVVTTLGVMTFITIYNDFLWPSLVVNSNEMRTMTVGVASLVQGANFVNPARMMASTVVATIPSLIVFLVANKYIVKGITNSGIK